eukprot:CAMPEP_0181212798 /NCGR_PEP_ID=MMETSP1096-20121128/24551_1 /TAXON_ID=156174 ORGANISM="Chrysochromulina ericina, Strain CCMP281" /NCGR_SAMPLE_ID=MMETSP1096 /ASSEMBLY_ACC=CAM_ASM_000453 /LENGTH=79 /DNA_ID=CAMNT_0023304369 /DNA_START=339 /DNA_END=575 /DNA_ORIENTATION=-
MQSCVLKNVLRAALELTQVLTDHGLHQPNVLLMRFSPRKLHLATTAVFSEHGAAPVDQLVDLVAVLNRAQDGAQRFSEY